MRILFAKLLVIVTGLLIVILAMNRLSPAEATARLSRVGPNALPERVPDSLWRRFRRQFASPRIYILLVALAVDLGLWLYEGVQTWPVEPSAVGLILLFNAALGLYQEQRSEAALARLKGLKALLALAVLGLVPRLGCDLHVARAVAFHTT